MCITYKKTKLNWHAVKKKKSNFLLRRPINYRVVHIIIKIIIYNSVDDALTTTGGYEIDFSIYHAVTSPYTVIRRLSPTFRVLRVISDVYTSTSIRYRLYPVRRHNRCQFVTAITRSFRLEPLAV